MELIDDEGNLLGFVNVVDALVVLLVIAVVTAGAAFVFLDDSESEPETETTFVTLDLGQQPDNVAAAINEGDIHDPNPGNPSQLRITDVHLTPQNGNARVILRAEVTGEATGQGLSYQDAPPRLGRSLSISTNLYEVSGRIRSVGDSNELTIEPTTVVLRDQLAASDAQELTAGDEIRVAGRTVATVDDVVAYATNNPTRREVFVEATLNATTERGDRRFGGSPLRRGGSVVLPGDEYALDGRVERVGGGLNRGEADVLISDTVDIETGTRISAGDRATVTGREIAAVETVTAYATSNPDRKRVLVGLSLETLQFTNRERFGTTPVRTGRTLNIETETYELTGQIQRVDALEPRGAESTRTVTLRMNDVRADMANAIRPGLTETAAGTTVAEVTNVDREPSVIIATGDDGTVNVVDHPFNRDVTITAELRVRETTNGVRFKGDSLRQGSGLTLDLGVITVDATIVSIRAR